MTPPPNAAPDQARLPIFRLLLGVQALAAIVFGVFPLVLPKVFAQVTGYSGDDELVYRLGGAAAAGYFVTAVAALAGRTGWADLRVSLVATLTFTGAAALGSAFTLVAGDARSVVTVVLLAAAAFAAIATYWLRRDVGLSVEPGPPLDTIARAIVALATLSAAVFGILPLLVPAPFASLFRLTGTDIWIYRMAGAACFGYATAGVLEFRASGFRRIAVQNLGAIGFNAFAAVSSWLALASGGGGLLAPVVALAATFFTMALSWIAWRSR